MNTDNIYYVITFWIGAVVIFFAICFLLSLVAVYLCECVKAYQYRVHFGKRFSAQRDQVSLENCFDAVDYLMDGERHFGSPKEINSLWDLRHFYANKIKQETKHKNVFNRKNKYAK